MKCQGKTYYLVILILKGKKMSSSYLKDNYFIALKAPQMHAQCYIILI